MTQLEEGENEWHASCKEGKVSTGSFLGSEFSSISLPSSLTTLERGFLD